jgi:predicted CoA-substrate-specific enzyme activase
MSIFLGIDIGTVTLKIAMVGDSTSRDIFLRAFESNGIFYRPQRREKINQDLSKNLLVTSYERIKGDPVQKTYQLLKIISNVIPIDTMAGTRICGSSGKLISEILNLPYENDLKAIARGVAALYPHISTIIEIGGQSSKYIALAKDATNTGSGITDYEISGDCAAGTGSFLDEQAARLKFNINQIGEIVSATTNSAKIAGRCSVFAKSDMIHAQQKGYSPQEVLKGLCEAVARNFKSSIMKGKKIVTPALLLGGVARNNGVRDALRKTLRLNENQLLVPEYYAWMAAIGSALTERDASLKAGPPDIEALENYGWKKKKVIGASAPLSMQNVVLLRNQLKPGISTKSGAKIKAYIGVDIGSVSTNVVVIDCNGNILTEIYTRTDGRPIEVVARCLKSIDSELGEKIEIRGVGTTGSGRELIGELLGSDTINDEITAHKTGAEFIAQGMLDTQPDTIFEIGGQDSKYISIENGVVVDFAMNEACAAGTGSFLEERAEELGISIKGQFADLALSSRNPAKLGERCTVFMGQDVALYQQKGVSKEDLTAGLAYSIVHNYLNRVVGRRKIGNVIFFQGGTAYNDAIAAAFAKVLDREIIVPPYNGVIGAVGAALLAREKETTGIKSSKFRGYDLEMIDYTLKEFICKACSNYCNMQEFTVEGEKTYWGDQCSDKFRRRQASEKKPVINDLLSMRRELLFAAYEPQAEGKATIGFPRGMYVFEHFPFWNTFFRKLGYRVLLSNETNTNIVRQGCQLSVAEPCLPIQVYHGHVHDLLQNGVDWIFIPNMISAETPFKNINSYYCPWGQTLPFVIKSAQDFTESAHKIINPPIRFREGKQFVAKSLHNALQPLQERKKSILAALKAAYDAFYKYQNTLQDAGKSALRVLRKSGEIGIILVGRVYNLYDRRLTLDIGNKLRDYYGINVIPMDFLPLDTINIEDVNSNMYWNYGRKIIAAAKFSVKYPNLHLIYLTNFKCGPDSYIKHYIKNACGKPFLSLQFDEHSNDAGYITRCEAYLDSKGALRQQVKQSDVYFDVQEKIHFNEKPVHESTEQK